MFRLMRRDRFTRCRRSGSAAIGSRIGRLYKNGFLRAPRTLIDHSFVVWWARVGIEPPASAVLQRRSTNELRALAQLTTLANEIGRPGLPQYAFALCNYTRDVTISTLQSEF